MATRPSSSLLARAVDRLFASLLVTLVFALWPHLAYAAAITVDGATCTLPDAITAANMDGATGGCTAGNGDDTLLLTAPIYALATGPYSSTATYFGQDYSEGMSATPSVTTTIVVSGGMAGAIVERRGSAQYRLFYVDSSGDLTLEHVTVRLGDSTTNGGAIYNEGMLTLFDSQLFSNTAPYSGGGIYHHDSGTVILANAALVANIAGYEGEGGGFANHGTAKASLTYRGKAILSNSDFFSNTARSGRGLYAAGYFGGAYATTTELTKVNFIANVADAGGGLHNGAYGGTSTTIISNTNFISNRASFGGGISNIGTIILTNSHVISNIADYGGGINNINMH